MAKGNGLQDKLTDWLQILKINEVHAGAPKVKKAGALHVAVSKGKRESLLKDIRNKFSMLSLVSYGRA